MEHTASANDHVFLNVLKNTLDDIADGSPDNIVIDLGIRYSTTLGEIRKIYERNHHDLYGALEELFAIKYQLTPNQLHMVVQITIDQYRPYFERFGLL